MTFAIDPLVNILVNCCVSLDQGGNLLHTMR